MAIYREKLYKKKQQRISVAALKEYYVILDFVTKVIA